MFHLFSHCMLTLILLSRGAVANAQTTLFNDPTAYFGGSYVPKDKTRAYMDWVGNHGDDYTQSLFLPSPADESKGAAVHWRLDDERIHLAVATKAQGWAAFGFSENGGMQGSDVIYLEAKNPNTLVDAHILEERIPIPDDCQDWTLVRSHIDNDNEDGFIIFEASRMLDTGDLQDHALVVPDGDVSTIASRIIAAWGDTSSPSSHGPNDRVRGQVRWFGTAATVDTMLSFQEDMATRADGFFEHRAKNYQINTTETQYVAFCMTRDELIAAGVPMDSEKLYLIGFEPIVDPRAVAHVHHFTVSTDSKQQSEGGCSNLEVGASSIYGWAPGEQPTVLPKNVGLPFGDNFDSSSLRMVVHYDNPQGVEDVWDSSGVRYYYTTKPQEHELGLMALGDPLVRARGDLVGNGLSSHTFACPASCSSFVLQDEPVTVFRQYIHMHRTGIAAQSAQIRNGEIIRTASVDFFAFDQQGNHAVQQEAFQILPGDSFRLTCVYDSPPDTVFGLASSDEMCMSSFQYFPRKSILNRAPWVCAYNIPFASCNNTYQSVALSSKSDIGRKFGISSQRGACLADDLEKDMGIHDEPIEDVAGGGTPSETTSASTLFSSISRRVWIVLAFGLLRRSVKRENLIVPLVLDFS